MTNLRQLLQQLHKTANNTTTNSSSTSSSHSSESTTTSCSKKREKREVASAKNKRKGRKNGYQFSNKVEEKKCSLSLKLDKALNNIQKKRCVEGAASRMSNSIIKKDHAKGTVIGDLKDPELQFKVDQFIGRGSFGFVFSGLSRGTPTEAVAMKVETISKANKFNLLNRECKIYQKLHEKIEKLAALKNFTDTGFSKVLWFGTDNSRRPKYRYLVMDYLGPSLGRQYNRIRKSKDLETTGFSIKTILMMGLQIVERFEVFHGCTFVHRDIKPENFLIGTNQNQNVVYLIDFGLCKRYLDPATRKHIPMAKGKSLVGTIRYAPIACHEGHEQSRKDDLEAVAYMLAYFLLGKLPWQGIGRAERDDKVNQKILELKKSFDKHLTDVQAPNVFREYLAHVRKLEYEEEPDYDALKNMFLEEMKSRNISCDMKFDWMESVKARKSND